jgi:hypothetical protein
VPSLATLDKEIEEIKKFTEALDSQPDLEWVIGINCKPDWTVKAKKSHAAPLAQWAHLMKQAITSGRRLPSTWPKQVTSWIVDELGLVFCSGEPLTEIGLDLSKRSPLPETLLTSMSNGSEGYLGTDLDRQRGGYEMYTCNRYTKLAEDERPLPYALGASERFLNGCLTSIKTLLNGRTDF